MTFFRLLWEGMVHHRRIHLAVALGVAAATAVLCGALVVGDSVRGSLRHLALDRLQRIDEVLVVPRFFRAQLADEVGPPRSAAEQSAIAAPVVFAEGTVEDPKSHRRATHANILGIDERFQRLAASDADLYTPPAPGEVYLNEALAQQLGIAVGADCLVRLPVAAEVPADSALGRKTETVTNLRLKVTRIVPATGLGRFALRPNQSSPRDAFLNLADVQKILDQPGKVNAILASTSDASEFSPGRLAAAHTAHAARLRPTLADYGLTIRQTPQGYFLLESDRMLLEPAVATAAELAFAPLGAQAAFTYLANRLADGEREIPYATITAIDFAATAPLGGFENAAGEIIPPLADGEIALDAWAADDLHAQLGDTIHLSYFDPESTHGAVHEEKVALRLAAIVAMKGPAIDRNLTPNLPGVTDQLTIADWNPPFPFDSTRIRPRDEDYWDEYQATPKAFVSLATGRKLWGSRFGNTTSLRIPPAAGETIDSLSDRLKINPADVGFAFQPVKLQAIYAASGTTPFEFLFLGFSFFIILSALLLVAILFRLGVEQRADQVGVLLALGWPLGRVRRLLLVEGALVALAGAALGVIVGVGYAWLMITGLRTWWVAAITTPFLRLFVMPTTLVVGSAAGVVIACLVIYWALRRLRRYSVRSLMSGNLADTASWTAPPSRRARILCAGGLLLAIVAAAAGSRLGDAAQALAFFASGGLVLVALLSLASIGLRGGAQGSLVAPGRAGLAWLAWRNAARHPGRSTLTIGLIAAASFLIIAISAFHLDPQSGGQRPNSGTGGFALVAESDQPIYQNFATEDGQDELGFSTADRRALAGVHTFALRASGGDDASCLNLYQARQPRVLGAPAALVERGGFDWAGSAAATAAEVANPWLLLSKTSPRPARELPGPDDVAPVPCVLDQATALYSLHLKGVGDVYEMTDGRGRPMRLQVVGLLRNSILQGALVIAEEQFQRHFPDAGGYRFFLIDAPATETARLREVLDAVLGDFGFAAQPAAERLADFFAVQNTYLSTFQSLGGLGLLLGTFGLAAVQLRNVVERRGELALLRAAGFRRALLARLVMWENALLLIGGLAIGSLAALVAVIPHLLAGGARLPWSTITSTLVLVLAVGLAAGLVAVRAALRAPLLAALRKE